MSSQFRKSDKKIRGEQHRMDDSIFYQPFPLPELEQADPFILLHHWGPNDYSDGKKPMEFGAHPHRGFEPVTFVFEGEVFHRDSLGNESIIHSGGVQWMTAGKGIVHSEGPTPDYQQRGGTVELIQVWINLPRALKMTEPNYQGLQKDAIPQIQMDGEAGRLQVVSGQWLGTKGAVESISGIRSAVLRAEKAVDQELEVPERHAAVVYVLNGAVVINEEQATGHEVVTFKAGPGHLHIKTEPETRLLLLSGEPLHEPVVQQGPFVMNTRGEILQAMQDFQSGKMGVLE